VDFGPHVLCRGSRVFPFSSPLAAPSPPASVFELKSFWTRCPSLRLRRRQKKPRGAFGFNPQSLCTPCSVQCVTCNA